MAEHRVSDNTQDESDGSPQTVVGLHDMAENHVSEHAQNGLNGDSYIDMGSHDAAETHGSEHAHDEFNGIFQFDSITEHGPLTFNEISEIDEDILARYLRNPDFLNELEGTGVGISRMVLLKEVVQAITRRGIEIAMGEMREKISKRQMTAMLNNILGKTSGRTDYQKMKALDGAWRSFRRHQGESNGGVMIREPSLHGLFEQ